MEAIQLPDSNSALPRKGSSPQLWNAFVPPYGTYTLLSWKASFPAFGKCDKQSLLWRHWKNKPLHDRVKIG